MQQSAQSFHSADIRSLDPHQSEALTLALLTIARTLNGHLIEDRPCEGGFAVDQRVRSILNARRARDRYFDEELFADPSWDILLELYSAHLSQQRISISSACIGAAVPATTALRWIKLLVEKGYVMRREDPLDARRSYVFLSEDARERMEKLFANCPSGETLL